MSKKTPDVDVSHRPVNGFILGVNTCNRVAPSGGGSGRLPRAHIASAGLIAELLAALKEAVHALDCDGYATDGMKALIAKAERID